MPNTFDQAIAFALIREGIRYNRKPLRIKALQIGSDFVLTGTDDGEDKRGGAKDWLALNVEDRTFSVIPDDEFKAEFGRARTPKAPATEGGTAE